MTIQDYQKKMMRTANKLQTQNGMALNGCLGLAGESGEVIDMIKKWYFQGHSLDTDKLAEEIGDVMWYVSLLCNTFELDLATILSDNIDKLMKRYPDGFKEDDSINRVV